MKKFSKLFMVVACLAMVFCFSAGASAAVDTADSVNVTLNLQEVNRAVTPITTSEIDTIKFDALSTDTLKTALDKAKADTTNKLTDVKWKDVEVTVWDQEQGAYVPTGEIAQVLESLTYDGETYTNKTLESTSNTYKGKAWSYFYGIGETPASSWDYPALYLSQVSVADLASYGNGFTLSYEYSEMSW